MMDGRIKIERKKAKEDYLCACHLRRSRLSVCFYIRDRKMDGLC